MFIVPSSVLSKLILYDSRISTDPFFKFSHHGIVSFIMRKSLISSKNSNIINIILMLYVVLAAVAIPVVYFFLVCARLCLCLFSFTIFLDDLCSSMTVFRSCAKDTIQIFTIQPFAYTNVVSCNFFIFIKIRAYIVT